ncbi:MAG: hypothetical protein A2381_01110 [Bdellovibrionales bacterium RIFOXYB1_FULL_37_110]|nr:MAG: hypothetical protein A2417_01965 [Bdellovibrionales bacterium RIFOXYC1_FULL_37_79]OFZ58817.1 MAG: hypothetical protein A2381_01110 [Bdellovibrionales bacterium RIFOXYB1_FULL_37_110]OFZ64816.1 MAG: hypothetical protein A2577_07110 [Bdellovibrionales bacterium RIFOXYD1_FULL_36_51]
MKVFLADLVHSYVPAVGTSYEGGNEAGFVVPYGIASIASYAKKIFGSAIDVSLYKFPNDLLQACADCMHPPDVIGFSNYVWNSHLNLAIGTKLRQQFPNALIVVGGPSVQADESGIESYLKLNRFIDICVMHEGERPFAEILGYMLKSRKTFITESRPIKNTGFLSPNGQLICTPNIRFEQLDELPSPYLMGELDCFMSKGFVPLFETNRGCPFQCAYCAWGIAALNKIRKFPMDRIFAELNYVSKKMPNAPTWFFADANFGILRRDVEIAQRIREIKNKNSVLKTIVIYESKNTPKRNLEIAKLLRNQSSEKVHRMDNALIALQTLDPVAQEATKRSNIKLGNIAEKVDRYQAEGYGVRTDILSGLPRETHDAHLDTLRKVFAYHFDQIGIYNVVLLPGTEMATQSFRDTHHTLTKFFTRDGYWGEYDGIRSVESEEVICGNSAIPPEDLLNLRLLHWAIWFGWNHKFLKPMLRYASDVFNKNPADVLYSLVKGEGGSFNEDMRSFFKGLRSGYCAEFFESPESLRQYYFQDTNWTLLKSATQKPTHLMYNAKLIRDQKLFKSMLNALQEIILLPDSDSADYKEICRLVLLMRVEPDAIFAGHIEDRIFISMPSHLARYFFEGIREVESETSVFTLQKTTGEQDDIRKNLILKSYVDNPLSAICSTIGLIPNAFTYDLVCTKFEA